MPFLNTFEASTNFIELNLDLGQSVSSPVTYIENLELAESSASSVKVVMKCGDGVLYTVCVFDYGTGSQTRFPVNYFLLPSGDWIST